MPRNVNLYDAKTNLSALVEEAAEGEEIIIAKNGVAKAKLVPLPVKTRRRKPANALQVQFIADDFDAPDEELADLFEGK